MTDVSYALVESFAILVGEYVKKTAYAAQYAKDQDYGLTLIYLWKVGSCKHCKTIHHHRIPYLQTKSSDPSKAGLDYHLRKVEPGGDSMRSSYVGEAMAKAGIVKDTEVINPISGGNVRGCVFISVD